VLNNSSVSTRFFFIPSLTVDYRKILNSQNSLRYSFTAEFLKPNIDYISSVQLFTDPQQQQVGNVVLKPSKSFNAGVEWVFRKKAVISYGINLAYGFDQYDFFRLVNPATSIVKSFANNGLQSFRVINTLNYQKRQLKKTAEISEESQRLQ
jgi:hypothetical protein